MAAWWTAIADLPMLSAPIKDMLSSNRFHDANARRDLWHTLLGVNACALNRAREQPHNRIQMTEHGTGELAGDVSTSLDFQRDLFQLVPQLQECIRALREQRRES